MSYLMSWNLRIHSPIIITMLYSMGLSIPMGQAHEMEPVGVTNNSWRFINSCIIIYRA